MICPRCYYQYFATPALSREDDKTEICPDCGTEEATLAAGYQSVIAEERSARFRKKLENANDRQIHERGV